MNKLFNKEYLEMIEQLPSYEEYQYWEYLQDRKIIFNQDVDLNIVNRAILNIIKWNEEDDNNDVPIDERREITLYITTNGGCLFSCLALIDVIKASKTPVTTVGIAVCASAGALLLMSGHYRKAYSNTTILIHDGSISVQSTNKKAKQTIKFYDELDDRVKEFVLANTKISKEVYEAKEDEEWFLFASVEGLELGIVDEIIK